MTTGKELAKSRSGNLKGGSRKGVPNKITADVKAMVLEALHHAGGAEYLCMQALDNPKAFMSLLGRILPLQVTGENGGPVIASVETTPISDETLRAARIAQILALAEKRAAQADVDRSDEIARKLYGKEARG